MEMENIERQRKRLLYAVMQTDLAECRRLIETGVDVNSNSNDGMTVLMVTAMRSNTEVVKMMIDAGANVNLQDKYGETALMSAVEENNSDVMKMLLMSTSETARARPVLFMQQS